MTAPDLAGQMVRDHPLGEDALARILPEFLARPRQTRRSAPSHVAARSRGRAPSRDLGEQRRAEELHLRVGAERVVREEALPVGIGVQTVAVLRVRRKVRAFDGHDQGLWLAADRRHERARRPAVLLDERCAAW